MTNRIGLSIRVKTWLVTLVPSHHKTNRSRPSVQVNTPTLLQSGVVLVYQLHPFLLKGFLDSLLTPTSLLITIVFPFSTNTHPFFFPIRN